MPVRRDLADLPRQAATTNFVPAGFSTHLFHGGFLGPKIRRKIDSGFGIIMHYSYQWHELFHSFMMFYDGHICLYSSCYVN